MLNNFTEHADIFNWPKNKNILYLKNHIEQYSCKKVYPNGDNYQETYLLNFQNLLIPWWALKDSNLRPSD